MLPEDVLQIDDAGVLEVLQQRHLGLEVVWAGEVVVEKLPPLEDLCERKALFEDSVRGDEGALCLWPAASQTNLATI